MASTETASSLFRDECKVILVQGGGSEWRSCNLTFVCFTTGFTIVIQAEISPPLTVKESRFNTIWLQFSLIIITATCRHMQKAAHLLETYKCISPSDDWQQVLTFFGGQSLESTLQKPVCSFSLALLQEERGILQPHWFFLTETPQHCVIQFFCLLEWQSWVRSHRFITKPCSSLNSRSWNSCSWPRCLWTFVRSKYQ